MPSIIRTQVEPAGPTQITIGAKTPAEVFSLFMTDQMLAKICVFTSDKMRQLRENFKDADKATFKDIGLMELKAFIGVLIMSGAHKDNHLTAVEMWSHVYGCPFYRSNFSECRFAFIIRSFRFDDPTTRTTRLKTDRFAHVRDVWDKVIQNCKANYSPGPHLTVDEQLLAFRGCCIFRMYLPNKPSKYGLKLVMACDADTLYTCNAIPYLGKGSCDMKKGVTLGEHFTMELVAPFKRSGHTVTCDNWFTSLPLARSLSKDGMHLVGTIRPKPYLPSQLVNHKVEVGESVAVFNYKDQITLLNQRVSSTKRIMILSTLHHNPSIVEKKKTQLHMFYNATKGGVDAFDQLCLLMSCSRKTRRWPLCLFYGAINIVFNNAYIIYAHRPENKGIARRQFAMDLAVELCRPYAGNRLLWARYLPRDVVSLIRSVFDLPEDAAAAAEEEPRAKSEKWKRCYLCPSSGTARTKVLCRTCHKSVCTNHTNQLCSMCYKPS
ncbi:piggyBac transposable element-derived protein 4-like [Macrobrachium rosenbergii]|uniref:piggyBac transposable element-derived protein 4-like n=1 Tax=Macrobrachium rosenbergii TaxID=79674 RepID=UPI0034D6E5FA